MKKRFLALFMAIFTLISVTNISGIVLAEEATTDITIYLSISKYGEIVKNKNGNDMSCIEISLSGKESYNIDDALAAAHALHNKKGSNSYASSSTPSWGLSLDKLWNDTSYNFGYQVNGGSESVMNLEHEIEDGDFIDAYIMENSYPNNEAYTAFEERLIDTTAGEPFSLALVEMGYDSEFNTVFTPCEGATITINGACTDIVTDADGYAEVIIEDVGTFTISAQKTKTVGNNSVTAIVAPSCTVTVAERPSVQITHNIAKSYMDSDLTQEGGNLPWILADLAVYQELYPENGYYLCDAQKQIYLDKLIEDIEESPSAGNLAKTIIALRALGYDASKVYNKDLDKIDIVSMLTELIDEDDSAISNVYTLPYIIIALSQDKSYASNAQMKYLLSIAVDSKEQWQDTEWGTDAITPMLLALAPYCGSNTDVETVVAEGVDIVKSLQLESGLILVPEDFESASAALAIAGFAALGIDSETVTNGGENLINGLMSMATPELDGFDNAFAKEQGLRGLLAHRMLKSGTNRCVYNFSDYPMNEAYATWAENCPVTFNVTPENAKVSVRGAEPVKGNKYDLENGRYSYTVSKNGYKDKEGTITISRDDALNHTPIEITVSLSRGGGNSGGSGGVTSSPENNSTEQENDNAGKENQDIHQSNTFTPDTFPDVSEQDWYYTSVKFVCENNLFMGTEQGFDPDGNMTRAMLATVLYRYDTPTDIGRTDVFADVPSGQWYSDGINWAAANNIVSGVSATDFAPNDNITREQIAVIIYRYAIYKGLDMAEYSGTDLSIYNDFENISDYAIDAIKYACATGIISGRDNSLLAPDGYATRAEVATILMRFIEQ